MQPACSLPIKRCLHRPQVNLGRLHLAPLLCLLGFFMTFWDRHFSHRSVAVLYISGPESSSNWRILAKGTFPLVENLTCVGESEED